MDPSHENQRRSRDVSPPEDSVLCVRLQTERPQGTEVDQGDAKISTDALITRGLTTCTGVMLVSSTHNFLAHADSETDPEWLSKKIRELIEVGGQPIGVFRFNCHGQGPNEPAEAITREALKSVALMEVCQDIPSVNVLHTVIANSPGSSNRVALFLQEIVWVPEGD